MSHGYLFLECLDHFGRLSPGVGTLYSWLLASLEKSPLQSSKVGFIRNATLPQESQGSLRKARLWLGVEKKKIRHRAGACAEQPAAATQEPGGVSFTLFLRGHSLENTRLDGAPQASQLRRNQTKRQPRPPTTHFRSQSYFPVRPPVPVPPLTSGLLRFRSGRLFRPL